jgi:hypothetical protein
MNGQKDDRNGKKSQSKIKPPGVAGMVVSRVFIS